MDKFCCSFCGDKATEGDGQDRIFLESVIFKSVMICDLCLLHAIKQLARAHRAEREYLSWGNDGKKA